MSNELEVTCPSGLAGVVRGLLGRDIKLLSTNRSEMRSGESFDKLLAACWLRTTSNGPLYDFTGVPDWSHVLVGDRMYALIQIRMATYPDEPYSFRVHCQECRERIDWELDLRDLPVKALPPASAALYRAGNKFPMQLPGGATAHFKLLLGRDERRLRRYANADGVDMVGMLRERIVDINGETSPSKIEAVLNDMPIGVYRTLRDAFEEVDCGVETGIDVVCKACGATSAVSLPFDQGFLLGGDSKK